MIAPGPTLQTERLILRPPATEDFDAWAEWSADAETMRHIGGPQARSVAWRSMRAMAGAWTLDGFGMFSVIEKASGRWIGRLGPWSPEGWPGTEVGWGVSRDVWGRGYASEGVEAAMDWAFETLGWTTIIHTIDPQNAGSIGVARKLGSYNMGPTTLPAPYEASHVDAWGQTREEWRRRRHKTAA